MPTFQGNRLKVNIQKNGGGTPENKMFDLSEEYWNVGMSGEEVLIMTTAFAMGALKNNLIFSSFRKVSM